MAAYIEMKDGRKLVYKDGKAIYAEFDWLNIKRDGTRSDGIIARIRMDEVMSYGFAAPKVIRGARPKKGIRR